MTKFQKLFWAILFLLGLVYAAKAQNAGTINVQYNLTDFISQPQAVQRLVLSPLTPYAGVGYNGNIILVPAKVSRPTGTNGSVTISNVVTGYPLLLQLLNQQGQLLGSWTNYFATNLTGTVSATNGIGFGAGPVFGWVFTSNNYATVAPGTNVTFTTNNGILSVNSSGGGGTNNFSPYPNIHPQNMQSILNRWYAHSSPPIKILFMGDSMGGVAGSTSPSGYSTGESIVADLPLAEDQQWVTFGADVSSWNGAQPNPAWVSFVTNWWTDVLYAMQDGSNVTYDTFTNANRLEIAWFPNPQGNSTLNIYTNTVLMATVNGYSTTFTSAYSNWSVPNGNYTVKMQSAGAGTNLAWGAVGYNTNLPGFVFYAIAKGGSALTNVANGATMIGGIATNTITNIMAGIQPDLVIYHAKDLSECGSVGQNMITSWLSMYNQYNFGMTNARWVVVGTPDTSGSTPSLNGAYQNAYYQQMAATNPSLIFADAYIPLNYYTNWGTADGTHPTLLAANVCGRMIEHDLGFYPEEYWGLDAISLAAYAFSNIVVPTGGLTNGQIGAVNFQGPVDITNALSLGGLLTANGLIATNNNVGGDGGNIVGYSPSGLVEFGLRCTNDGNSAFQIVQQHYNATSAFGDGQISAGWKLGFGATNSGSYFIAYPNNPVPFWSFKVNLQCSSGEDVSGATYFHNGFTALGGGGFTNNYGGFWGNGAGLTNLPPATSSQLGVVQVDGTTITANGSGVISASYTAGTNLVLAGGQFNVISNFGLGITNTGILTNNGILTNTGNAGISGSLLAGNGGFAASASTVIIAPKTGSLTAEVVEGSPTGSLVQAWTGNGGSPTLGAIDASGNLTNAGNTGIAGGLYVGGTTTNVGLVTARGGINANNLNVTNSTSLDDGQIFTDGNGGLTIDGIAGLTVAASIVYDGAITQNGSAGNVFNSGAWTDDGHGHLTAQSITTSHLNTNVSSVWSNANGFVGINYGGYSYFGTNFITGAGYTITTNGTLAVSNAVISGSLTELGNSFFSQAVNANNLNVTNSTSLDGGAITTDGAGEMQIQASVGAALTLYGDNSGDNIANIFVNGSSIEAIQVLSTGAMQMTNNAATPLYVAGSVNGYYEALIGNTSTGANASADFVAENNAGAADLTLSSYYVDVGINGTSFKGYLGNSNMWYLYGQGNATNGVSATNTVSGIIASPQTNAVLWLTAGNGTNFTGGVFISNNILNGIGSGLSNLNASQLLSGTVPTASLGSGTANSTTFLRGDQTWATPGGGSWTGNVNQISGTGGTSNIINGVHLTNVNDYGTITANAVNVTNGLTNLGNLYGGGASFTQGVTNNSTAGFTGNGANLTNINAANFYGTRSCAGGQYGATLPATGTRWGLISGVLTADPFIGTETNVSQVFPSGVGLWTNLTAHVNAALGAGTNITFTLRTNGVSTGLTVTLSSAASIASDSTHFAWTTNAFVDMQVADTLTTPTFLSIYYVINY